MEAARLIPPLPTARSARHPNHGRERPLGRSRIKPHPDDRSIFCNAILRWNGQRFVAEESGVSANLRGGWGGDPGNVWAVGEGGTLLHKDGAKWQSLATDTSATLESVIGTAEGVFAVGGSNTVLRWDGTALGRETTSCAASLLGIAVSGMDLISVGEGYCMTRRSAGVWGAMPSLSTPPTDKSGYFSVVGSNGGVASPATGATVSTSGGAAQAASRITRRRARGMGQAYRVAVEDQCALPPAVGARVNVPAG